jgi:hypothetical protein
MTPHPLSPRGYCDRLGLAIDLSKQGAPAIVSRSGKRHYYAHGSAAFDRGREMCDVLARLERFTERQF